MQYYPIFLDISKKPCLVVGGGKVAERKVRILITFKTAIRLVSPKITRAISRLSKNGAIEVAEREYMEDDLEGIALVFAATNNEEINARIKVDAEKRNIPVNVVDNPKLCDFIVPSIVKKGPVTIAISTSGTLPSLSKRLRQLIAGQVTNDYVRYAYKLGKIRKLLIDTVKNDGRRKQIMKALVKLDIKELNGMSLRKIMQQFLIPEK
ncbi:MAG: siroheme synthase [Syntrophus sp. (in: bacteria)]|nr:siroheme synthase [Syntrophus sp. (in: bacteria)]